MFKLFLLLNPIYATLFWAIVLSSVKPQGNEPKTFLGKFFFVACMTFVSYVFYFLPLPEIYVYEDSIYLLTHLSIFPMYYIYVRLLTVDRKLSWRKHYIHFVTPAILIVLYLICVFCMSKEETIDFIYNKLVSNEPVTGVFLFRKIIYNLTRITFIIQGIVYMTQSILVVRKNLQNVVNFYSNTEDDSLDKVQWLNITVSVTMSTCIVMEIFGKERFTGHDFLLIGPSIVFTVMLFIIGWLGNKQRAVLLPDIEEDENDLEGKVTKSQNIHIKKHLQKLFDKDLIYLDKDLTIWELASKLGTNRTYVSQIINNEHGQNFSAFVNSYRISHAENLLESNPKLSPAEIAEMSGFGCLKSWKRAKKG